MLKRIGAEESGEFKAVASGTLPSGKPVIVNADGTVSLPESVTGGNGTPNTFSGGNNANHNGMSEVGNSKFVIAYRDSGNSHHGTAVVATGSGTTLSYGTPVVFDNQDCREHVVVYDSNADRVVIFYYGAGDGKGYAIVGTVSGTSISFGTRVEIEPTEIGDGSGVFDPINNKVVFFYKDVASNNNYGTYVIGTVSGSSVSFTTPVVWHSSTTRQCSAVYDTTNNKMAVAYRDVNDSSKGKMFIIDPGASSLTFGSEQTFHNQTSYPHELVEDTVNGKLIIFYAEASQSGAARVITVDGANKTISAGNELVYESGSTDTTGSAAYNTLAGKAQSMCKDQGDSNKGKLYLFTVSGTSISLDSTTVIDTNGTERFVGDFSPSLGASVFVYTDEGTSQGEAFVTKLGYNTLTSENYIGMSRGVAFQSPVTQAVGTPVAYKQVSNAYGPVIFDPNSNKVVIAYIDSGDSSKGKCIVGTISGTSISFGSEVTFETTSNTTQLYGTFDSTNNKVILVYRQNYSTGNAIVGTVSGNSISFGSTVAFSSDNPIYFGVAFDSTNNKIVISYRAISNSNYGTAVVGTVSGTSISFGSEVVFKSARSDYTNCVHDSTNNKIVVTWTDQPNSNYQAAIVGTVSGTSISFGSAVTYFTASSYPNLIFNPDTGTVVAIFKNDDNGQGSSKIGTVSGTSISFSAESIWKSTTGTATEGVSVTYDSNAKKIVIAYRDGNNGNDGYLVTGTVGSSSITYDSPVEFADYDVSDTHAGFDSVSNKVIITYADARNTDNYGTAVVFRNASTETIRGQVTNGQAVSMDIIGSVSDNQIGLTAGQQYFVQTDGTIGTTAATPSVLAGTAISATELVVKT